MKTLNPPSVTLPFVHSALIGSPLLLSEVSFMTLIKKCVVCNTDFFVKPSQYNRRVCCSKDCQKINQKKQIGKLNNNYKGGPKTQKCEYCGKEFIPNNPYAKRKYCSRKCSTDVLIKDVVKYKKKIKAKGTRVLSKNNFCSCGNRKQRKHVVCDSCKAIKKSQQKPIIIKICPNCGNEFKCKYTKTYCSKECFKEHLRLKYLSDKNPNWEGGVKAKNQIGRMNADYVLWRNSVFIRDNYTCQKCGQIGNKLHAHHIKKWSKFKELRLDINNGITLCVKCHRKEHKPVSKPNKQILCSIK